MSYYITGDVTAKDHETALKIYEKFEKIGLADGREENETSDVVDISEYVDDTDALEELLVSISGQIYSGEIRMFDEGDSSFLERYLFDYVPDEWICEEGAVVYMSDFDGFEDMNRLIGIYSKLNYRELQ